MGKLTTARIRSLPKVSHCVERVRSSGHIRIEELKATRLDPLSPIFSFHFCNILIHLGSTLGSLSLRLIVLVSFRINYIGMIMQRP